MQPIKEFNLRSSNIAKLFATFVVAILPVSMAQPEVPRIESVVLASVQPHTNNPAVIWYDDFDTDRTATYLEPAPGSPDARRSAAHGLGGRGASMECFYPQGRTGIGNRKLVFGDCPFGKPLRAGEHFQDIYWRFYVKHQKGWSGSPDKMTRATGFVSSRWNQAFISHIWSSGLPLTLDPASGIKDGEVVTTKYNDFGNLRWLGNKPNGQFPIHDTAESGRWVCVESRLRVNTPGQKDGLATLWIDGVLDTVRTNMDFRGSYTGPGSSINAIFLEAYWNAGAGKDQYRWYDDFVVSTQPIGPITADPNPTLVQTTNNDASMSQVEIASDSQGTNVVWRSASLPATENRIAVNASNGKFLGLAEGRTFLRSGPLYFCRVRQMSRDEVWSAWSPWHQPFSVAPRTEAFLPRLNLEKRSDALMLQLTGESVVNYSIEASPDLLHWLVLTNITSPLGVSELDPADTMAFPRRFYRARGS
jgi:hypothetical protein